MKNWLDSSDYTACFLADLCRRTPARTHDFSIFFPRRIDLDRLPTRIPSVRVARSIWNLAPYWKIGRGAAPAIEQAESLESFMNMPLRSGIHAANLPNGAAFRFHHLLFDGVGAEECLESIFHGETLPAPKGLPNPHLDDWKRQFESGRAFMRHLSKIRADGPIAKAKRFPATRILFRIASLGKEESARLEEAAGTFFLIPCLLAIFASGFSQLAGEGQVVVPMTVDLRDFEPDLAESGPFFNRWAVVPLQVLRPGEDPRETARRRFVEAVSSRLPQAIRHASFLIRIAPFFFMKRFFRAMTETLYGSFLFSFLPSRFEDAIHLPTPPPRPGVGIFVTKSGGRLHFALSYREGVFPERALFRWFDDAIECSRGLK